MVIRKKSVVSKKSPKSSVPGWIWMLIGSVLTLVIGGSLYLWQPFNKSVTVITPQDGSVKEVSVDAGTSKNDLSAVTDSKKDYQFYDVLPEQESTPIQNDIVVIDQSEPQKPAEKKADVVLQQKAEPTVVEDVVTVNKEADKNSSQVTSIDKTLGNDTDSSNTTQTVPTSNVATSDDNKKPDNPNTEVKTTVAKPDTVVDPIAELIAKEKSTTYILQINSFGSSEEADKRRAQVLMAGVESRVIKTALEEGGYLYQVLSNVYKNRDDVFLAQKRLQDSGIDTIVVERKPED